MSDKLDPARIMERLRQLLADCEREIEQPSGWQVRIHVHATCRPRDGSGGMISITIGPEPADYDEDDD
jgi:hypothetical protein